MEKLKIKKVSTSAKYHTDRNVYSRPDGSFYEEYEVYRTEVQKARQDKTLKWDFVSKFALKCTFWIDSNPFFVHSCRKWLDSNTKTANERSESLQTIRADVEKLEKRLVTNMKLVGIEYDCDWNIEHIRGCLKSLEHLFNMHTNEMKCLQGWHSDCLNEMISFIHVWIFPPDWTFNFLFILFLI